MEQQHHKTLARMLKNDIYYGPHCPKCDKKGADQIMIEECGQQDNPNDVKMYVAYCAECGHIYGMLTNAAISFTPLPEITPIDPE